MCQFEVCIHTCEPERCHSARYTSSRLWVALGHAAASHAIKQSMHTRCHILCPGYAMLGISRRDVAYTSLVRPPTNLEIQQHLEHYPEDRHHFEDDGDIQMMGDDSPLEVFTTSSFDSPILTPSSTKDSIMEDMDLGRDTIHLSGPNMNGKLRRFNIIYIPDPTRISTMAKAVDSLSFIRTSILKDEYESIKHLVGSVFKKGPSKSAFLQEWVSLYYIIISLRSLLVK